VLPTVKNSFESAVDEVDVVEVVLVSASTSLLWPLDACILLLLDVCDVLDVWDVWDVFVVLRVTSMSCGLTYFLYRLRSTLQTKICSIQ
jgi:hypothetical protein